MTREKLLLATTNPGKLREIRKYLAGLPLEFLSARDLPFRLKVREKGESFQENAREKSLAYSRPSGLLTLAEDSGLEVDHLRGAPGIYSARFSDPKATDEKNIQKVLRLMEAVPGRERKAQFVCCMVLSKNGRIIKETKGKARGRITFQKKGTLGFGYDPIFYYPPLGKTFGQLSVREKSLVSHRGRALRKMRSYLHVYLEKKEKEEKREEGG